MDSTTGELVELEYTVIVLEKLPILLESYLTLIVARPLLGIGSRGHEGVVHPQDVDTLLITRGSLPVLINSKSYDTSEPLSTLPKLWSVYLKVISALSARDASSFINESLTSFLLLLSAVATEST